MHRKRRFPKSILINWLAASITLGVGACIKTFHRQADTTEVTFDFIKETATFGRFDNHELTVTDHTQPLPTRQTFPMASVARLNHAVLYVSDVERSVAFYTSVLGFEPRFVTLPNAAFLRAEGSPNDHDLGLFRVGSRPSSPQSVGLYHLAWQVDTIDDLVELRGRLVEAAALVGESDHGVSKSLYAHDPDGIEFEVMWAVPRSHWPDGPSIEPLDLDAEQARWGATPTLAEANIVA
jgi:catechol 2,3-dioxygenase-like lactoylglutathione lyase family enzyme